MNSTPPVRAPHAGTALSETTPPEAAPPEEKSRPEETEDPGLPIRSWCHTGRHSACSGRDCGCRCHNQEHLALYNREFNDEQPHPLLAEVLR